MEMKMSIPEPLGSQLIRFFNYLNIRFWAKYFNPARTGNIIM